MVNILFCGNEGVFDGVLTAALSILMRTPPGEPFTFYLFTMDLTRLDPRYTPIPPRAVSFLERVVKQFDARSAVVPVDVTGLYEREFGGCPNEGAYCSPYTLLRLLADLVDGIPKDGKLLYLDADILFQRDVHLLWDIDVEGCEYAAARDHYGKYLLYPNYVNAGVILFNMTECRKNKLFDKARQELRRKKFLFADQTALIHATTKKKLLPQRFNDQKFLHTHTVVRHFSKRLFYTPYPHTENIKQWQVDKVHEIFHYYEFDDILNEYLSIKSKNRNDKKEK